MSGHDVVLEILMQAVSQDPRVLKPAEQKLEAWETEPGFYAILKDVFCNHSIEENVRLIAVLYFKNGVDKYWRPNAPNAISEDEKTNIRQCLPYILKEPSRVIAVHLSVLIAKIARYECPQLWPDLLPEIMKGVKGNGQLEQLRALMLLHEIIKSLSTKRLMVGRKMFQDLTAFLYPDLFNVWDNTITEYFYSVQQSKPENESIGIALRSLYGLKILEKMTIRGFKSPSEDPLVDKFLKLVIERTKIILQMRKGLGGEIKEVTTKYILRSMKVLQRFLSLHPLSFENYLSPVLEFIVLSLFTPEGEQYIYENFILQAFILFKTIVSKVLTYPKVGGEAERVKNSFFTQEVLNVICRKLINHYLLFSQEEIEMWEQDPESFGIMDNGEAWKFYIRPSVEEFFTAMFKEFKQSFVPIIVDLLRQNEALVSPEDVKAVFQKDAIYNVVGLVGVDLYDEIDFENWLTTTLMKELSVQHNNYKIIKRRILWLIGCWIGIKISPSFFPLVYSTIINFLKPEEDMVVRLTAANTMKYAIDIFEFDVKMFLEFLEPSFFALFNLLKEAQECDTKMRVLHVLYFIIERVENYIEPYYNNLVQYLPVLWEESGPHNMLRCAVVTTLVNLVKALGKYNNSVEVYNFILNVIAVSTDDSQSCSVYLLEDGLELWLAVVENLERPSPPVLQLFKNMPALLENKADSLRICISITSCYVLLAPNEFLQAYGERIVHVIKETMADLTREGLVVLAELIELFLRVNPYASSLLIKPLLPKLFESIVYDSLHVQVLSIYMSIMARVILASKEVFVEIVSEVSSAVGESKDEVFSKFIDSWLDKMPRICKQSRKKLLALAISSLLPIDPMIIYNKFCGILLAVSDIMKEIIVYSDQQVPIDTTIFNPEDCDQNEIETEHNYRERMLASRDIMNTNLLEYFQNQLMLLQNSLSEAQFGQFLQTVDVETMAQVRQFVPL